jgi:hypothetical protein
MQNGFGFLVSSSTIQINDIQFYSNTKKGVLGYIIPSMMNKINDGRCLPVPIVESLHL